MDLWVIGNKAGLLAYLVFAMLLSAEESRRWEMLAYLLYMCVNIAIPIFRRWRRVHAALAAGSALAIILIAAELDPRFVVLLPANLYELSLLASNKRWPALLAGFLPTLFIPRDVLAAYILAASLSFLLYAGLHAHAGRVKRLEEERETLRLDVEKLRSSLSLNDEYIRQSAYTSKLEERNRLSQRIHDEVGHAMAGALIQMEASRRLLASSPDKSSELLGNAIAISKEGLERIRLTLKDMKPRSEELGIHRLRLFMDELSAKHAIQATVTHAGNLDLITPLQWKIIHENAVEAVTNSLKYGQANAIELEVRVLNRMIQAVVADNGVGAPKIVKGLGIVGMEERAAGAGGTVIVDGSRGFRVTTLLPHAARE